MADDQAVEHISLESGVDDEDAATPRHVNAELVQQSERRGYRARFVIFNGEYIAVRIKAFPRYRARYTLGLGSLDPDPTYRRRLDWMWLGTAFGLLAATAVAVYHRPPVSWSGLSTWWPSLTVITATAGIVALLMFVQRYEHRVTFYSRHARTPLLTLLANKPSRSEYQRFLADLRARIERAHRGRSTDKHAALNAELREHRRLLEAGFITPEGYATAKATLLSLHT